MTFLQKKFVCTTSWTCSTSTSCVSTQLCTLWPQSSSTSLFDCFSTYDFSLKFKQSAHDSALFTLNSNAWCVFLLLYVDGMIIANSAPVGIKNLNIFLYHKFDMKDLGPLLYFLGSEVAYSPEGYLLSQTKYCKGVIQRAGLTDA